MLARVPEQQPAFDDLGKYFSLLATIWVSHAQAKDFEGRCCTKPVGPREDDMISETAEDMSPKDQKTDLLSEGNVTSTNGDKILS